MENEYCVLLERNQELQNLLGDFVSAVLVEKPEELFSFARDFFSMHRPESTGVTATRPLIVCGPSGVGKSVILKRLFEEFPGRFGFSVSHTTRQPREGEVDGRDYHFVSREEMEADIRLHLFLEHAEIHGNLYGTSRRAVQSVFNAGQNCLLDVDVQGVESLRKAFGSTAAGSTQETYVPFCIFIAPPSLEHLEERLRGRGSETEETLQRRLSTAKQEMFILEDKPHLFDRIIVNDDLEKAINSFKTVLREMSYV